MSAWRLFTAGWDWTLVGTFDDLAVVAARIREIEGYPATGVRFEFDVDPLTTDAEALSQFEHVGQINHYIVLRIVP